MVSTLAFAFKIIRHIIFFCSKKVSFPQSRNFSTIKELFCNQETCPQSRNFPQSRKFFAIKELFYSRGTFPQPRNFSRIKELLQSWNFSTVGEICYKKILFYQRNFPQTMKFSKFKEIFHKKIYLVKETFYKQESFPQKSFSLIK